MAVIEHAIPFIPAFHTPYCGLTFGPLCEMLVSYPTCTLVVSGKKGAVLGIQRINYIIVKFQKSE